MEKAKILIVEDEAIIAMEIENQLLSLGYEVTSIVDTGEKAIKKAEEDNPDLILMDIRIKGEMDGIEAAEVIRNKFGIPVIFSTAYLDEERIERTKITMPFGYVLKPIQERDLKVTIEMASYVSNIDAERKKTEASLFESEQKYRLLFETMINGFALLEMMYDNDGNVIDCRYIDANPAHEKLTKLKSKDIIGKTARECIEGLEDAWIENYGQVDKTGEPVLIENYVEGLKSWYKVLAYRPTPGLVAVVFENITARKKMEKKLKVQNRISDIFLVTPEEQMYGKILDVVLDAMESKYGVFGYIDEDGALICPSMTRDIWDQCEIPDKNIVFPRETWGGIWGSALIDRRTIYSNEPFNVPEGHLPVTRALDVPIIYRSESIGNLLIGNKETDYEKEDCALLESISDHIAPILYSRLQKEREKRERKVVEEKLINNEKHLQNIIDVTWHPFYVIDAKTRIVINANKETGHDAVGKTCHLATHNNPVPCNTKEHPCPIDVILQTKKPTVVEHLHIQPDGSKKFLEIHATPLFDDNGDVEYIVESNIDITDRK